MIKIGDVLFVRLLVKSITQKEDGMSYGVTSTQGKKQFLNSMVIDGGDLSHPVDIPVDAEDKGGCCARD